MEGTKKGHVAVLNVVRMGDEPKRLSEIGQLVNRVNVPNLQYATRKLVKAGLIETEGSSSRKQTRYRVTDLGRSVTEDYTDLRAATLPPMLEALEGWAEKSEAAGNHPDLIASLCAQAAQAAITRRISPNVGTSQPAAARGRTGADARPGASDYRIHMYPHGPGPRAGRPYSIGGGRTSWKRSRGLAYQPDPCMRAMRSRPIVSI